MKGARTHVPLGAATKGLRDQILLRHAALGPGGGPSRCQVTTLRKAKVIFPTRDAAGLAEWELAQLGALRQSVYGCGDHFHLSKLGAGPEVER